MKLIVTQSRQAKLQTELKVDYFNKKILKGKKANDEIQKDAFLKLLVTELKHQNPLDPMKDRDFIAQMAQLTSVEKLDKMREGMENMAKSYNNNSLYSLLGRKVNYVDQTTGKAVSGAVDAVEFKDGQGYVLVNKTSIRPKQIMKVE